MRQVIVRCLNDNTSFSLGSDVGIIYEVIQRGKAIDQITYKLELNGKELLEFINSFKLNNEVEVKIYEEYQYVITAYDW